MEGHYNYRSLYLKPVTICLTEVLYTSYLEPFANHIQNRWTKIVTAVHLVIPAPPIPLAKGDALNHTYIPRAFIVTSESAPCL